MSPPSPAPVPAAAAYTSDGDNMLRAVLAAPADDAPRLEYADWLDEHGEPERAEFIRLQVELAPLAAEPRVTSLQEAIIRRRERELWAARSREWFVDESLSMSAALDDFQGPAGRLLGIVRRGFVASVALPAAAFVGTEEPCPHCEDAPLCPETNAVECSHCDGTGVIGEAGLAAALFAAHPVTEVRLTDKEPAVMALTGSPARSWVTWYVDDGGRGGPPRIPIEVFQHLPGEDYRKDFPTWEAAIESLSRACVAYGRSLAKLPALAPVM